MQLLFDEDYRILESSGLSFEEDTQKRYLILRNFPLKEGLYIFKGDPIETLEVLLKIPSNYNTSGGNMFWTFPKISRSNGKPIPAYGGSPINHNRKVYDRWSRHWRGLSWKSKVDNIRKILGRVEWALKNPDANR